MVLPPEYIDLEFVANPANSGKNNFYTADVGGYMNKWYIPSKPSLYTYVGKSIPDKSKLDLVKYYMS